MRSFACDVLKVYFILRYVTFIDITIIIVLFVKFDNACCQFLTNNLCLSSNSGKTTTATSLASRYDIPVLNMDDIIMASFSTGTLCGSQARDLCAEAARRLADDSRQAEDALLSQRGQPGGGLSTDALTVHSQVTGRQAYWYKLVVFMLNEC